MAAKVSNVGRQGILEVAENLFTERGYRAVSIRDIAKASGVTNAALYYHFPNKEALFREVMELHAARLSTKMRRAGEMGGDTRQRLSAMLTQYADLIANHQSGLFGFRREAQLGDRSTYHQHRKRLVYAMLEPLEDVLEEAQMAGELRALPKDYSPASLLLGMLHGLGMYRMQQTRKGIDVKDIDTVVNIFWHGMADHEHKD